MLGTKLLLLSLVVYVSGQGVSYYEGSTVRTHSRLPPQPLRKPGFSPNAEPISPLYNPDPAYQPPQPKQAYERQHVYQPHQAIQSNVPQPSKPVAKIQPRYSRIPPKPAMNLRPASRSLNSYPKSLQPWNGSRSRELPAPDVESPIESDPVQVPVEESAVVLQPETGGASYPEPELISNPQSAAEELEPISALHTPTPIPRPLPSLVPRPPPTPEPVNTAEPQQISPELMPTYEPNESSGPVNQPPPPIAPSAPSDQPLETPEPVASSPMNLPPKPAYQPMQLPAPVPIPAPSPPPEVPFPDPYPPQPQPIPSYPDVPPTSNIPILASEINIIPVADFQCIKGNAYYIVASECDAYIKCQNQRAWKHTCPDGLHFNPKASYPAYPCAYPSEVKCESTAFKQTAQPTSECPHRYGFFPVFGGDCSQYLMCQGGKAILMDCPLGLVFNDQLSSCDWPVKVPQCNLNAFMDFTCPIPQDDPDLVTSFRYGTDCKLYVACQHGHPRLLRCSSGLSFDENSQFCIDSDLVTDCRSEETRYY